EAHRFRLASDVDGNSMSSQYCKLLASKRRPWKQTLVREWHDERRVSWAHYVPASLGMEELCELVTTLAQSD
ncbi:hypothetical protein LY78DRAFT_593185, partial [Colletotrichum sublineola]